MNPPVVAVVGAGIAGLGAAQILSRAGLRVDIFEKSQSLGGRIASRQIEGCIIDHGAQYIKPSSSPLETLMLERLPTDDLAQISLPVQIYTEDGQILPPEAEAESELKYSYHNGLTMLPKLLFSSLPAELVTLHFDTEAKMAAETEEGVSLYGDSGQELIKADAAALTMPVPQAADLLVESGLQMRSLRETLDRVRSLRDVEYNSCLSVVLGYPPNIPTPPYYALLAQNRSSHLLWLAFEQCKSPLRAPKGESILIAQLGPLYSRWCFAEEEPMVVGRTINELHLLFGETYDSPVWSHVTRWKYSQPRGMVSFSEANPHDMLSSIWVSGDGTRPDSGRIHQAYSAGLEAAQAILQRLDWKSE